MNVAKIVSSMPDDLKLMTMKQTVLAPKFHALKLFRTYNDGLACHPLGMHLGPFELSIEKVSRLSGSRELARMYRAVSDASKIPKQNLTSIALNSEPFPINRDTTGLPQIKVDLVDDLFCMLSNGQDPFSFQGEIFSGGVALFHGIIKDVHRVCMGLPNYDLAARNYECQDCDRNYLAEPEAFLDDKLEFCNECLGLLFARLQRLEQVYIVVPGLPKARKTDQRHIIRYGDVSAVARLTREVCESDPACVYLGGQAHDLDTYWVEGEIIVSHTTEAFGSDGPCSFEGDGITLYEVSTADVPVQAVVFLHALAWEYTKVRVQWTNLTMGTAPPPEPRDPMICGGLVEFKFLSYSEHPETASE